MYVQIENTTLFFQNNEKPKLKTVPNQTVLVIFFKESKAGAQ
jgi:hypothetical protein